MSKDGEYLNIVTQKGKIIYVGFADAGGNHLVTNVVLNGDNIVLGEFIFSDGGNGSAGGGSNTNYTTMLIEEAIPVAISLEGSFSGECGYGSSGTPYGGIIIFRGNDAWTYTSFSAANIGVGWFGVSATASQTTYFYFGDLDNFGINSFSGTSYQVQLSGGELIIGGGHINVVIDGFGGVLFGVGPDIGFGVGSPISGQGTWQTTKLH